MKARRPSTPLTPIVVLGAVLAASGLVACSSSSKAKPVAATQSGAFNPNASLERAIKREVSHPSDVARKAPPPPGLDASPLAPIPPGDKAAYAKAHLALDRALDEVGGHFPEARQVAPLDISPDDRRRAMTLYARGHALRLDGQYQAAIHTLESAAKLDPDAAAPWREIGEARLDLSDRHGAAIAFTRSFERDPQDLRVLEQLASLPSTDVDDLQTAALLTRLYRSDSQQADPALEYLIPARLGGALLRLGYLSAGTELLEEGVGLPERFDSPSNRAQDLAALYRRRGDIWTSIGDASMQLDKPERALDAYSQAARLPSLDPTGLLLRRVYAAMVLGRPAAAASFVVDAMAADDGRADDQVVATLRYIAENSKLADEMDSAILSLQASLPESARRIAAPSIVRARAAVLPPDRALEAYRDYLAHHPTDESVLAGLFSQLATAGAEPALREAISLTAQEPLLDTTFVGALLRAVPDPGELLSAWSSLDDTTRATPPAQLIHAQLLAIAKRPSEADRALRQLLADDPGYPPALIARVRLLEVLDRGREADELLASIKPGVDVDLAYAKALALTERDELAEAERVVQSALAIAPSDAPRRIDLLLLGATLGVENHDATLAEQRYQEVLALDPSREDAHAGLIQLYATGGALANDQKLVAQLASLRDTNPSSRLLRTLRARDALQRGQYDLAERDLLALTEEFPDDDQAANTLVQLWMATNAQDRAEQWLQRQMARFPSRNAYDILLAQTYLSEGRDQEAANVLDAWLAQYPGDVTVSQILEQVYETRLNDKQAANRLRARRLENAGDSEATAAERAAIYLELDRYDEFLTAARQAISYAKANDQDLTKWGNETVTTLYRQAVTGACPPEVAVQAQGLICDNIDLLDENMHLMRIEVVARAPEPTQRQVEDAITRAVAQYPNSKILMYRKAIQFLTDPVVLTQIEDAEAPAARQRAQRQATPDEITERFGVASRISDEATALADLSPEDTATILAVQYRALYMALSLGAVESLPSAPAIADRLAGAKNKDALLDAINVLPQPDPATRISADPARRSELAQYVADTLSTMGKEDGADAYSELAIRYDPHNENANNNYGYRLLERNDPERLDDAVRMIERAYSANPNASNVVDSLGWARYKSGMIYDVVDAQGAVVTPGAVTLLQRALKLAEDPTNTTGQFEIPILCAHLGDALWLSGDREGAIDCWRRTVRLGNQVLDTFPDDGGADSILQELRSTVEASQQKVDEATTDRRPSLAPVLRPVNRPGANLAPQSAPAPEAPANDARPADTIIERKVPADPG